MRLIIIGALFISSLSIGIYGQSREMRDDYRRANTAGREGDFAKAAGLYRSALAKLPLDADKGFRARLIYNLGVALYRSGSAAEAIPFYEESLTLSRGKYVRAQYALGMALADTGDQARAAEAFRQYLEIRPQDGEAWFDLGLARYALGELGLAKEAFARSYENGTVAAAHALNNIGVILAREGDLPGAIKKFTDALSESGGNNPEASANLDICLRNGQTTSLTTSNIAKIQEKTNE